MIIGTIYNWLLYFDPGFCGHHTFDFSSFIEFEQKNERLSASKQVFLISWQKHVFLTFFEKKTKKFKHTHDIILHDQGSNAATTLQYKPKKCVQKKIRFL